MELRAAQSLCKAVWSSSDACTCRPAAVSLTAARVAVPTGVFCHGYALFTSLMGPAGHSSTEGKEASVNRCLLGIRFGWLNQILLH